MSEQTPPAEPQTVDYVANPSQHPHYDPDIRPDVLLGAYKVRWNDGLVTMSPHLGRPHTMGAIPLNVDDPEEREVVMQAHRRIREQALAKGRPS